MKTRLIFLFTVFYVLSCAQVAPIAQGHAHNDYMHQRPLMEALENGFTSIEIDVFLHNNNLIVSHDAIGLDTKPDIESLYLKPIQQIIGQNSGHVYGASPVPVIFMIDMKTQGDETYKKLKEILSKYSALLAQYSGDSVIRPGPIHILISGNKPFNTLAKESTAWATLDASIKDMNRHDYDRVITRYSDPWEAFFTWKGKGEMPAAQRMKLDSLVSAAHRLKKQIRFYHIPDNPDTWKVLLRAGVDWINTDKLAEYSKFRRAWTDK